VVLLHSVSLAAAPRSVGNSYCRNSPSAITSWRRLARLRRTDKIHDFKEGQGRRLTHLRRFLDLMCVEDAYMVAIPWAAACFPAACREIPRLPLRALALISSAVFARQRASPVLLNYDCTASYARNRARHVLFAALAGRRGLCGTPLPVEPHPRPGNARGGAFQEPQTVERERFGQPDNTPYGAIKCRP